MALQQVRILFGSEQPRLCPLHAWNKHGLGRWGRGMGEAFLLQYFYHCGGAPGHGVEIPMQVGVNGSTEPSC